MINMIVNSVRTVLQTGITRLQFAAETKCSVEGWLKIELGIMLKNQGLGVQTEKNNTDIYVQSNPLANPPSAALIELKTFPTNYGGGGKPITNFINGVIVDLTKLAAKRQSGELGISVWFAYYVPNPLPQQWPAHLAKIQKSAKGTLMHQKVPLMSNMDAHAYVMESW